MDYRFSGISTPTIPQFDLPDMRSSWHQLLVIGNGFDLACGLKSSFGDFVNARKAAFEASGEAPSENPLCFTETIWDVILDSVDKADWCNVEGAMLRWLVTGGDNCERGSWKMPMSLLDETLDALAELGKDWSCQVSGAAGKIAYSLVGNSKEAASWTRERLLALTRQSLRTFERDFASYMQSVITDDEGYHKVAFSLMGRIVRDERPDGGKFDVKESVLSFNYTYPCVAQRFGDHPVAYVNVHGRLSDTPGKESEIVFGIDGTDVMDDADVLPFTKTYRIMGLGSSDTEELIHAPSSIGYSDYGTALIKFFGHSLGRADYSYFQAIFDSVKLYEGRTRLIFYYCRHSRGDIDDGELAEELARIWATTMRDVIALLSAYGKTLDNKDHGRNLIHKLLIEGRLAVLEFPWDRLG